MSRSYEEDKDNSSSSSGQYLAPGFLQDSNELSNEASFEADLTNSKSIEMT